MFHKLFALLPSCGDSLNFCHYQRWNHCRLRDLVLQSWARLAMKLSSKWCDRTAVYKDVPGGCWSSWLREGSNSWLSLVSFGRFLGCVLLLWRKKSRSSFWLSLKKVAAMYFQAHVANWTSWVLCLQAVPGFCSSRVSQKQRLFENGMLQSPIQVDFGCVRL